MCIFIQLVSEGQAGEDLKSSIEPKVYGYHGGYNGKYFYDVLLLSLNAESGSFSGRREILSIKVKALVRFLVNVHGLIFKPQLAAQSR
jgi:hypothetical protein